MPRAASPVPKETGRYRFERKFFVTLLDRRQVESIVRLNDALFSEIYHPRWINNVYFDTWNFDSYHDNQVGSSRDRIKVRVRWYGDLAADVEKPVLELKIKHGLVNRKESFRLPPMRMDATTTAARLYDAVRAVEMTDSLRQSILKMKPAFINRYYRNYFRSADRAFRVTIDSDLFFHALDARGGPTGRHVRRDGIIVELKYTEDLDARASTITQGFPFRMTRSSKFVTGIESLVV